MFYVEATERLVGAEALVGQHSAPRLRGRSGEGDGSEDHHAFRTSIWRLTRLGRGDDGVIGARREGVGESEGTAY